MNEFKEKWGSDPRFKTKIKLSLYTLFVVFVAIFAFSNRTPISTNEIKDEYNPDISENQEQNTTIEIPQEYNYKINVTINDINYQYTRIKTIQKETITKENNDSITNYIYENNSYYKEDNDNYILCAEEEVYDIINYDYINLETINEYLSKSTKKEDYYVLFLKDIVLGNSSEEYIKIVIEENIINIDYTPLMNNFDKTIDKCLIRIEIESIE